MSDPFCVAAREAVDQGLPNDLPALVLPRRAGSEKTIRICAVGDIVFSNGVRRTAERQGYRSLFQEVAPFLQFSAVCFGNLECALSSEPEQRGLLVGVPEAAAGLRAAGITVAHLANNHVYDAGPAGLASTLAAVRKAAVIPLGAADGWAAARDLVVTESAGRRIGWLGCGKTLQRQMESGPHFWEFNETELLGAIRAARDQVDVLIASIHIGYEYIEVPSPEHRELGHRCIAAGADVVLMHHAHVLQGLERVGDRGIVCYNLGNFLMDPASGHVQIQTAMEQRRTGAVFIFDVDANAGCQVSVLPTYLDENCCVRWAVGDRGLEILHRLAMLSAFLKPGRPLAEEFARQRAERNLGSIFTVIRHHLVRGNWRILWGILAGIRLRHFGTLLGMLRVRLLHSSHS